MTVGDLIAELTKYAPETEVERYSEVHDVGTAIDKVTFHPAKPACVMDGIHFGPEQATVLIS